ncbi:MAG TPA: trehalase-like domain-containing protein, partial [Euzebyales bacterium]|nr:trehalase-like domain-containing protein [Euzebyales bacterium]
MTYAPIAEHGLIGDLQSAALVATDGTVDWFCCPRFDSPSVFASVLDDRKGGRFALTPLSAGAVTKQMYLPDTAILVTRYLSEHGVAEVLDFMPIQDPQTATDRRRLVRAVIGIRGEIELEARIEPRFDYGRRPHTTHIDGQRAHFECAGQALHLASSWPLERDRDDVHARFTVRAGDRGGFVLSWGAEDDDVLRGDGVVQRLHDETAAFWRRWLERSRYRGRWREAVERSAITLKLMTYAPT